MRHPNCQSSILSFILCLSLLLLSVGCDDPPQTELSRTHAYMDSLRTALGELRQMDHKLNQEIAGHDGQVSAAVIVPIIRRELRPTLEDLLSRSDELNPTAATADVHEMLETYLQTRLNAYNLALQGSAESRPELYEEFALKQIEAETLGRELGDVIYKVRSEITDYN